jgi:hypothetical protein
MANNTSQFGSGSLFINPNGFYQATNPTPFRIGILQDQEVNFKGENVSLFGQKRLPDIVAPSNIELSIKATFATKQGIVISQAFLIGTVTAGVKQLIDQEAHSVPATSTYTVTVSNTPPILVDYGVQYAATTRSLTRVASGPTQGQYSVNLTTGVYTFAAADASAAVLISYTYAVSSTGQTFAYQNQAQGTGPSCQIQVYEPFTNGLRGWLFNTCYCRRAS